MESRRRGKSLATEPWSTRAVTRTRPKSAMTGQTGGAEAPPRRGGIRGSRQPRSMQSLETSSPSSAKDPNAPIFEFRPRRRSAMHKILTNSTEAVKAKKGS